MSDEQKSGLNNIGNKANGMIGNEVTPIISSLTQQGIITPEQASHLGNFISHFGSSMGEVLNHAGHKIVDAFETDTRNMFMASNTCFLFFCWAAETGLRRREELIKYTDL